MRHYETIFIINPDLPEEENREVIEKFNNLIEKEQGVIIKVDEWGKQRMAYEIKKHERGFYTLLDYCGDPGVTALLERDLRLDDRILKYQTVKLADKADPEELLLKEKDPEIGPEAKEDPSPPDEVPVQTQALPSEHEVKNGV